MDHHGLKGPRPGSLAGAVLVSASLFAVAFAVGCSSPGGATYCDVKPVLDEYCVRCHATGNQFGAPFSLATYASTRGTYQDRLIYEEAARVVTEGMMPPTSWELVPPVMPLEQEQIDLLEEWALLGAPSGGCR